jgi:AcrR family transcriptional regulator
MTPWETAGMTNSPVSPATRRPSLSNPRVQRTRAGILATARELLAEAGLEGLTYSTLGARAGVTRQTLYRHWPTRAGLLCDLILEAHDKRSLPPQSDVAIAAREWLRRVRRVLSDDASRTAVAAVTAQADFDPDSARALMQVANRRHATLNQVLAPSGLQISADEYTLLCGPVLTRIFLDRRRVTNEFIDAAVAQWCGSLQPRRSD